MANEFIARKGLIVLSNGANITGSVDVSTSVTASAFKGDGSQVTGLVSSSYATTSSLATNSVITASGAGSTITFTKGDGSTFPVTITVGSSATASYVEYNNVANKPTLVSASSQVDHDATTNFVANEHVDHSTVNISAGNGLGGGGDITTSRTLTLDTSSVHFLDGVKKELNTEGVFSSSAQVNYTQISNIPTGIVSSSTQFTNLTAPFTGSFTGSFVGTFNGTVTGAASTASYVEYANVANKPTLVSASSQIDHDLTTGFVSNEHIDHSTVNITAGNGLTGGGDITATRTLTLDTASAHFTSGVKTKLNADGVFSSSAQVTYNQISGVPAGIVSSSGQIDVRQTTGIATIATTGSNTFTGVQTISNTTNSTNYTDGALIVYGGVGIAKDVNISGSVNISGLLTVVSQSVQYVTSSQLTVGVSRVIVNDDDLVRFAGLSVIDSGSTFGTGSLLWDSLNNRWIAETDDANYESATLILGPAHTGTLGDEPSMVDYRVPVGFADHHIDNRITSSSIRVDFPSRLTHIEAGLYVTGAITSSVGFSGNGSGLTNVTAASVDYTNITNKPTLVSASSQIDHNATTNYVANQHVDHSTVNITAGLGLNGGGDITATRTLTLDTSSAHFTGGVVKSLPTGTISSSLQFNDLTAPFTGSFTGSFTGDGSGLTGIATILAVSASDGTTSTGTVNLKTQALSFNAGEGIDLSMSGQTLTVAGEDATTTNKGIASFNTTNFTVSSGAVTSKDITINGTGVTLGGTRNITLAQITAQGASTTDQVTLAGGAVIHGVLFTSSSTTSIAGPVTNQVVATIASGSYDSAQFDYVIKDGTNYRAGTVMAVWNGSNSVEFTDVSTNDIGNTLDEIFTVDANSGNIRLKFTSGTGTWTVKTAIRAL